METLLEVEDLKKYFPIRQGILRHTVGCVKAVDGVSFQLRRGETLGLVGESGCGKTTTGRAILRLIEPTSGQLRFHGANLLDLSPREMKPHRRQMQMIFQDPNSSLNPRMTVGDIIAEPLHVQRVSKDETQSRVLELLNSVGLTPNDRRRYPHAFSGGQRQRIGIARALALRPELIVADEPVSALDVSVQAQVLNLLTELQDEYHLSYIFVAHDLSVVEHISDRVAVMYLGRIVEISDALTLYRNPRHPYTEALLSAVPLANPRLQRTRKRIHLEGDVPDPSHPPQGCAFHPRCPYAKDICREVSPPLLPVGEQTQAACHFTQELALQGVEYG